MPLFAKLFQVYRLYSCFSSVLLNIKPLRGVEAKGSSPASMTTTIRAPFSSVRSRSRLTGNVKRKRGALFSTPCTTS